DIGWYHISPSWRSYRLSRCAVEQKVVLPEDPELP
ncbi:unnamed protein product, partial [marine sediment metagenome]